MSTIKVLLEPRYAANPPQADIYLNNNLLATCSFSKSDEVVEYQFDVSLLDQNNITIDRHSKTNEDTVLINNDTVSDQTLHIKNIIVEGVPFESLLHIGIFVPRYPEPWATQQRSKGIVLPESETYRSDIYHNGTWTLTFDSPIHPWFFKNLNVSI